MQSALLIGNAIYGTAVLFFSALKNEQLNEIGKPKCIDIQMSTPLQSIDIAHNYSTSATLIHCHGLNSAES